MPLLHRMYRPLLLGLSGTALSACASTQIKPSMDPGRLDPPGIEVPQDQVPPPPAQFSQPPDVAHRLGRMPLYSTGIPEFLRLHPTYDGRGVLIAILDSGIDAGIDGLDSTSTGERKILDLRDLSGEGRVPLVRVVPRYDTVIVDGIPLGGFGRVVLFNAQGPYYGGVFRELPLGEGPAADVDGNGKVGDSLVVIVTRASDGWIVMTDSDRDGSLAGERPVHDYLVGRETLGWAVTGQPCRLAVAANLTESDGEPLLDLFFDTSGHGSHVAGIAAGHDMYGVAGFDGVAPGAQLLGLKIANNAQGGLSTTGSMIRAIDYAIRFADRRRLPLVINLSFGVGNEIEGAARIDQMIDSVLVQHPELVFSVSAGNDGPGLSTLGFPGSATRALTAGAILPGDPDEPLSSRAEPIAYYSSRGGELAKPDIMVPGTAYSTVPLWDRGDEVNSGTSMASPHAAGLVALLLSALKQEGTAGSVPAPAITARVIKQALMVTARPIAAETFIDQGAGVPDIGAAYRWLKTGRAVPDIQVRVVSDSAGRTAAYHPTGLQSIADTLQPFELIRPEGLGPAVYQLRSSAPWLVSPPSVPLNGATTLVVLRYRPELIPPGQTVTGVVTGWPADTVAGPAFRLVTTIGSAIAVSRGLREETAASIAAGGQRRLWIVADSGRPFKVSARTGGSQPILAFLHEPGGMPLRGAEPQVAGAGQEEVGFHLDGRDVIGGAYELVAVAPPARPSSARFDVRSSPVAFDARREAAGVVARVRNLSQPSEHSVALGLIGGERIVRIIAHGSDTITAGFILPAWATHAVIDLTLDRAQWSRFTDLGMTLSDTLGAQIESSPLNYPFGRLAASFDHTPAEAPAVLRIFPGLAEPGSLERWTGTLSIRLYSDEEVPLPVTPNGPTAPSDEETTTFGMVPSPWPLGDGFFPLGQLTVTQNGEVWTREVPLPEPAGAPMR